MRRNSTTLKDDVFYSLWFAPVFLAIGLLIVGLIDVSHPQQKAATEVAQDE